jgi:SAM-dependent methyltransferase
LHLFIVRRCKQANNPELSEGTASYYSRYRRGYPPEAIETIVRRFDLNSSTRVLDLGRGTGQIAIPLAKRGIPVIAVDPDVEMLAEGLRAEQATGVAGIAWMLGNDATLEHLYLGPLVLCTMGASFHWMERDAVLASLDRMIVASDGVAMFGGDSVWKQKEPQDDQVAERAWASVVKETVVEFLGPERRAGTGTYKDPADRYEIVLARSACNKIDKFSFFAPQKLRRKKLLVFN